MSESDSEASPVLNALLAPYGLHKRSLEAEIQDLMRRYGAMEVRQAAIRLTIQKRGRKAEKDWPLLQDQMKRDARVWLSGGNPAEVCSNYAIANEFADKYPGHNRASTHRRIMGKLAKGREWISQYHIIDIAEREEPFEVFFRACEALGHTAKLGRHYVLQADRLRGVLEGYRARYGDPPASMTIAAIEAEMAKPTDDVLPLRLPRGGLFGLAGRLPSKA